MIYEVFIRRPRLAMVISILITIAGLIAMSVIPVAQYPSIAPPTVQVTTVYAGANTDVVESAVAQPIESAVNGVDGMKYMKSTSSSDGAYSLTVSFAVGTDPDIAAVNVQNRISSVESGLPQEVRDTGVTVQKAAGDILQVFNIYSPGGSRDLLYLSNYVTINVLDALSRIPGVGSVSAFGAKDYSMRIWLDVDKMNALGMTTSDVSAAIKAQNIQAPVGRIGAAPLSDDQRLQLTVTTQGRLTTVDEFSNIILRSTTEGNRIRLGDISRIELSAENFDTAASYLDGASVPVAIYLSPGANAVEVAEAVSQRMMELSERFPDDVTYKVVIDTAEFVGAMIDTVITTLLEAFVLVGLVVFIFLGNLRATIIPLIAVPVAIIGALGVMYAVGFSANMISLLALVLAIGIVVDDAIIVVENVERVMAAHPELSPAQATSKALGEISGSIIAITLVLLSVFVPVAFLGGSSGALFREFAVAISAAMVISAINALTLSPALCAILLRPGDHGSRILMRISAGIDRLTGGFTALVTRILRISVFSLVAVAVFAFAAWGIYQNMPDGFVPDEDSGYFFTIAQLPEGASLNRTEAALSNASGIIEQDPAVEDVITVSGIDFLGGGTAPNAGIIFVRLKPYAQRSTMELSSFAAIGRTFGALAGITEGLFIPINPPAIMGLGQVGGVEYVLQALEGQQASDMAAVTRGLSVSANEVPEIASLFTTFSASTPQVRLDIDRDKAQTLGVNIAEIFATLQATLGGSYINDFNLFGRTWTVRMQAEQQARSAIADLFAIKIRTANGDMAPLQAFATISLEVGARSLTRYNNYRAVSLTGSGVAGVGTGNVIASLENLSAKILPEGYAYEWTGQAQEQIESAGQTGVVLALALVFAYLFLVALYESWNVPVAVLLSVVVAVLGALIGLSLVPRMSFDLYAQVSLLVLVALAAKNAIMMNSFALQQRAQGLNARESSIASARLRFRPVLMTSIAFIAGLTPLVIASGPGAGAMRAVGIPVISGMIAASVIGILMIPALFYVFQLMREKTGWKP